MIEGVKEDCYLFLNFMDLNKYTKKKKKKKKKKKRKKRKEKKKNSKVFSILKLNTRLN